tara:strand:- start:24640 stop:26670 length:2031 start_codon:yes stop_codon:yes gene_type:complete
MSSDIGGGLHEDDKTNHYLSALIELGDILINEEQTSEVTKSILRLMLGIIMAPKGAIFLYSKKSDVYFPVSLQGFDYREPISADTYLIQKLEYHAKGFLDRKQAEQIKHKAFIDAIYDLGAEVTIPLFFRKEPLGILFIGEKIMGEKFTILDENVIRVVSNHLVKSLHNKRLLDDLDKKRKDLNLKLLEQQTLFDISVAISSMLDVEKLGEEILWRSVGVLNTSKGFILQEEKNSPILKVSSSFNWDTSKMLLSKKLKIFETINKSRKGVVFTSHFKTTIQKKLKEDHIIIAPIQTIKNNIGYMVLCNKETRDGVVDFDSTDLDLLTALCNQAAVAVDNARLFKDITESKQFNDSILGSIATGVITLNELGEVDSINDAGSKILKMKDEEVIGNHYMFLFEKDYEILELVQKTEMNNKIQTEMNLPFLTVSKDARINASASPREDRDGGVRGLVLAIEDISDVSRVKNTFKRYVSKQVVDEILDDETKLNLGGEKREITVLFSDIRGFTSMAESMSPESVVSTLNEHFSAMIDIVFKHNGTLDKIVGDQLMIVFGAPTTQDDDTERAMFTAQEMQEKIKLINKERAKRKEKSVHVGIGINRGAAVSGNIGSQERMDYTIIGDAVNLGARLCSAAGADEILISKTVYDIVKDKVSCKELEPINVKGKKEKISVYRAL